MKEKRIFTEEHRRHISESRKASVKARAQLEQLHMSKIGKKRLFTPEWVEKVSKNLVKKGDKLSLQTRKRMSDANKGHKNPMWRGGLTQKNLLLRHSMEYKLWRGAVFKRDGFTCVVCGEKSNLNADHIKPFALYPELRFAIDNGRTLCVPCHKETPTYGGKTRSKSI